MLYNKLKGYHKRNSKTYFWKATSFQCAFFNFLDHPKVGCLHVNKYFKLKI